MKRSSRRSSWWVLLVLPALGAGLALWSYGLPRAKEAAPAYETRPVARGPLAVTVTASGTLSPLVTVQVGSQVSGRILELLVDFNSEVSRGQVVARIDPSLFRAGVARARADLASADAGVRRAQALLDQASRKHVRSRTLAAKALVAEAEVEAALAEEASAKAQLAVARAALDQARAAKEQADTNLAYTTIVSPIDGVVISRDVDVGQTVAASFQAPTLFTIAEDLRRMEVHTSVAEADIGQLRQGMPVRFTVDAFPGESFAGEVRQVRYSPQTVQNVVTYDAVVLVDNAELKLRPGMTADVSFVVEERTAALLLPNASLRFRPPTPSATAPEDGRPGPMEGGLPFGMGGPPPGGGGPPPPGMGGPPPGMGGPPPGAGGSSRGHTAGAGALASAERGLGEAQRGGPGQRFRQVYTLGPQGRPVPRHVEVGISDARHTELRGGDLREGERVIVGLAGAASASKSRSDRPRFGRFL